MKTKRKVVLQCKRCNRGFSGLWDNPGRAMPKNTLCPDNDCARQGGRLVVRKVGKEKKVRENETELPTGEVAGRSGSGEMGERVQAELVPSDDQTS